MSFLTDPAWIAVIIAILAIIVAIFIARKQTNRKEISYAVVSNSLIISIKEDVKGRVQVLFDNKAVNDARLIILRIWNSGNVPITTSEYTSPIKFFFGDKTEILDAEIIETIPNNMNASLTKDLTTVTLEPVLLNPKEVIILKVLLTQYKGKLSVDARIVGTKQEVRSGEIEWTGITASIAFQFFKFLLSAVPFGGYTASSLLDNLIDGFIKEQEAIPPENRRLLTLGIPKEEPNMKKPSGNNGELQSNSSGF